MRNIFLICLLVSFISTGKLYAHDESGFISAECGHKYDYSGERSYSQVYFAFSINSLEKHGVIKENAEWGKISVTAEITNSSGTVEKFADKIGYNSKDGEVSIVQNWITTEIAVNKEASKEMKTRLGARPSVSCKVVY